mmetsp:Transcript_55562/g.109691  ORF Transcript_55562/g.109691 Transcript_55562/m.109691 type:complete len:263 (+) Transcript_55562:60-848(+)
MLVDLFTSMNERVFFTVVTCLVHTLTYSIPCALLFLFHNMKWFESYKIQGNGAYPDSKLIKQCIKDNIVGHLIVFPLVVYFGYPVLCYFGMSVSAPIPSIQIILRDLLVAVAINDTMFYWVHRALHHSSVYKYIHKQHHEFKTPIGIACKFAHPIEDIFANSIPTILGPLLMGSHAKVFWFWLFIRLLETIDAHSGYSFPLSPFHMFGFQGGADRHDFHHSHNVGCYGSFTIFWDWICGTDKAFLDWKAKKSKKSSSSGKTE